MSNKNARGGVVDPRTGTVVGAPGPVETTAPDNLVQTPAPEEIQGLPAQSGREEAPTAPKQRAAPAPVQQTKQTTGGIREVVKEAARALSADERTVTRDTKPDKAAETITSLSAKVSAPTGPAPMKAEPTPATPPVTTGDMAAGSQAFRDLAKDAAFDQQQAAEIAQADVETGARAREAEIREPVMPSYTVAKVGRKPSIDASKLIRIEPVAQSETIKVARESKPHLVQRVESQPQVLDTPVIPKLDPKRKTLLGGIFPAIAARRQSTNKAGGPPAGQAIMDEITTDQRVRWDEAWVPVEMILQAFLNPQSDLRKILGQVEWLDENRLVNGDREYAIASVIKIFEKNRIEGLCEKLPVTDEASAHVRRIRLYRGQAGVASGIKLHPAVFAVWNADHDGDQMKVAFNAEAIDGGKTAKDFLIGTEGVGKIDSGFFNMHPWAEGVVGIHDQLVRMYGTAAKGGLTTRELNGLTKAIEKTWDSDTLEEGFRELLRWAREVDQNPSGTRPDSMEILNDIWDLNRDIRVMSLMYHGVWDESGIKWIANQAAPDSWTDDPSHPGLLSEGGMPASLTGWLRMIGAPVGFVDKANQAFRITAGLAKHAREIRDFVVKQSSADRSTAEDRISWAISGIDSLDSSNRTVEDLARRKVMENKKLGRPPIGNDAAFVAWLHEFIKVYNREAFIVKSVTMLSTLAGSVIPYPKMSMQYIPTTGTEADTMKETRSQFNNVYGGLTMGLIFGPNCPKGAENTLLSEWVHTNRETELGMSTDGMPATTKQFIARLADMRTSFSKSYDTKLKFALARMMVDGKKMTLLKYWAGRRDQAKNSTDLDPDVAMVFEAMALFGPEVFDFLGLDSPKKFADTVLGRKFITANTQDRLGGVLYEAVARYRLAEVYRWRELYNEAKDGEAREHAEENFEDALNELGSSSVTWDVIVRDYRNNPADNAINKILFANLTKSRKDKLLNDMVKADSQGRKNQKDYEIASDLFAHPANLYSRDRFTTDLGHTEFMKNIKAVNAKLDAYGKVNWDKCIEQVRKAEEQTDAGDLKLMLGVIAADPTELVDIQPWNIADAVLSSIVKSYPSSEKAQQEAAVNYIYSAVSNLMNGGTFSDLTVGGDFALGGMAIDRFQKAPVYLAKLLSDPTFELTVYDETGASVVLTQAILLSVSEESRLGGTVATDAELWAWMNEHPRAAMALRKHTMDNSINRKTGFAYTKATMSLRDTIRELANKQFRVGYDDGGRRAMVALADHPGFYAMLAMTVNMTGNTRAQLRQPLIENVRKLTDFLITLDQDTDFEQLTYDLYEQANANNPDAPTVEDIRKLYAEGKAQEVNPLGVAEAEDVRNTDEYQYGQVLERFAKDLEKYSDILIDRGIEPSDNEVVSATELFKLGDRETVGEYFDEIQVMSAAKTMLSTSVNGAESRRNAALMFLAQLVSKICNAPDSLGVPNLDFQETWADYVGRQVLMPDGEYLDVSEVTRDRISEAYPEVVPVEDPAMCTSPGCPCKRHATADPSTNYGDLQTTSLGRLLTIVRTLSTEGLNLKVKTVGDDGRDSVTKNHVFDVIPASSIQDSMNETYATESVELGADMAMANARRNLAQLMKKSFEDMGYNAEEGNPQMDLDDYINVAQILIRPIIGEDGVTVAALKVLSVGQLNSVMKYAIQNADAESDTDLTHEDVLTVVENALADQSAYDKPLDPGDILAGMAVHKQLYQFKSKLVDQRMSSIGRNMEEMEKISKANPNIEIMSEEDLDLTERAMAERHEVWKKWDDYVVETWDKFIPGSDKRYQLRLTGVLEAEGVLDAKPGIGPKNAWIIDTNNLVAAAAIKRAYELGITVLLTEKPAGGVWKQLKKLKAGVDETQLVFVGDGRYTLPMFDIRLNGGNTTTREGAFNAGVFHAPVDQIMWYYENWANEHGAGDSEFQPFKWFAKSIKPERSGEYRIPIQAAFGGLIYAIRSKGSVRNPRVTLATREQIDADLLDPYVAEIDINAPFEFDKKIRIDLGKSVLDDSADHVRVSEGLSRYLSRLDQTEDGLLMTDIRPGEIIGWMRAEYDWRRADGEIVTEVVYHPIRPYEFGNHAGAPEVLNLKERPHFNNARQEMVLKWGYEGTMLGRSFKIFEALYAANKFMARPDAVEGGTLANGVKLAGYIAGQSTIKRRLFMRRQQKMMSLMYMARISPYGYNLAEHTEAFPDNPELKEGLLKGNISLATWSKLLKAGEIKFFSEDMEQMNALANDMATKAVRYGVNPCVVFASRYDKGKGPVPSNLWFNFQLLFGKGPYYQESLMQFMHFLNPTLCPDGLVDSEDTLFNRNLQVLVPIKYTESGGYGDIEGKQWVDLYGGFHFLDEHYSGYAGSGTTVKTNSMPTVNTLMAGGMRLTDAEIKRYLIWGSMANVDDEAMPNRIIDNGQDQADEGSK
jgi:hypothetical protein